MSEMSWLFEFVTIIVIIRVFTVHEKALAQKHEYIKM